MRFQIGKVFQEATWLAKGGEKKYTADDFDALSKFIDETSPDLLNDPALDLTKSIQIRTVNLSAMPQRGYQFALSALKYFISIQEGVCGVTIILDDMESKTSSLQADAIRCAMEARSCLANNGLHRGVPIRLIVALRPETYSWISQLEQVKTTVFRPITYSAPVSLFDLFKARFDAVHKREDYAHLRDKTRLDQALSVLDAVGEALAGKFTARFVKLCNYNLRASLETFRLLCCNRRWLQRDAEMRPFFTVEEHNFAVSQAAVLRALGMGEFETYPQANTCLANILWNTREPASDLLLLYLVKYLLLRDNDTDETKNVRAMFQKILGADFDMAILDEIMQYGKRNQLFHFEHTVSTETLSVTPRGKEIYEMLGETTLLLELFQDDMCKPLRSGGPAPTTRSVRGAEGKFCLASNIIINIWQTEVELRNTFSMNKAPNGASTYFGVQFEAERLRDAFKSSLFAYYQGGSVGWPETVRAAFDNVKLLNVPEYLKV